MCVQFGGAFVGPLLFMLQVDVGLSLCIKDCNHGLSLEYSEIELSKEESLRSGLILEE